MIKIIVYPIGNGAIVEKRGVDLMHALEEVFLAAHVQKGFLLAGEGSFRQVFRGGGRSYGDGEFRRVGSALQGPPAFQHLLLQPRREGRLQHPSPDLCADFGKALDVVDIEGCKGTANLFVEPVLREKIPVSVRRGGEAARYRDTGVGEAGDHLADGGILAANQLDVGVLQFLERNDVWIHDLRCLSGNVLSGTLCADGGRHDEVSVQCLNEPFSSYRIRPA